MKTLLVLIALSFSIGSFAIDADPNYCHGDDSCAEGLNNPFQANEYFARGRGHTPEAARRASESRFGRTFGAALASKLAGDYGCGMYRGAYHYGTFSAGDGTFVAWTGCPLKKNKMQRSNRPGCAMAFGVLAGRC